jgi:hypothetical protein
MRKQFTESNDERFLILYPEFPGDIETFVLQLRDAIPADSKVIIAGKASGVANVIACSLVKDIASWGAYYDWTRKCLVIFHDSNKVHIGKIVQSDWMPVPIDRHSPKTWRRGDVNGNQGQGKRHQRSHHKKESPNRKSSLKPDSSCDTRET